MHNIHEQAKDIHRRNYKWWHDKDGNRLERNRGELLMLVVSELAEAMEALRRDLRDGHLLHRSGEEVELADAYIRLLDYAEGFGIELDQTALENTSNIEFGPNKAEDLLVLTGGVWRTYHNAWGDFYLNATLRNIVSYAEHYGLDLQGAVTEKLAYNDTRADHTWEAREADGGKKF